MTPCVVKEVAVCCKPPAGVGMRTSTSKSRDVCTSASGSTRVSPLHFAGAKCLASYVIEAGTTHRVVITLTN